MKKAAFTLNGKRYMATKLDDGTKLVDGMSVKEWMDTLDEQSLTYLAKLGAGIIEGRFKEDLQNITNELHQIKNN